VIDRGGDDRDWWVSRIAAWISGYQREPLPPEVQRAAVRTTLDTVACAIGAVDHDATRAMRAVIQSMGGQQQSTMIGGYPGRSDSAAPETRGPITSAILYNGTLIRALDCNDAFLGGLGGHPSDDLAVALAFAEARHASGPAYLQALALGYELYYRVYQDLYKSVPGYRWDHVSTGGLVGAAIGGLLSRLEGERLAHALAIGGTQTYSVTELRDGEISMLKASANAVTAHTGALGVLLAEQGMTGPTGLFEGRRGLLAAFGLKPDEDLIEHLTAPITSWRITETAMKPYPAIGTSQGAISAVHQLVSRESLSSEDVEQIEVRLPDLPATRDHISDTARADPRNRETADHSFPFLIAVTVEDGNLGPAQFDNDRWLRPSTRELMGRVALGTDPRLNDHVGTGIPASVVVLTRSGRSLTHEVLAVPGSPDNPFSDEQIDQKLRRLAPASVPDSRLSQLSHAIRRLPELDDVARLGPALAGVIDWTSHTSKAPADPS
jgi:2-methylcitrate dehydratase